MARLKDFTPKPQQEHCLWEQVSRMLFPSTGRSQCARHNLQQRQRKQKALPARGARAAFVAPRGVAAGGIRSL